MTEQSISDRRDGGQPRFVVTGGATDAEVAALVTVLSAVAAGSAATTADPSVPDGRTHRELWAASLGPGLRSAITWRTSTWW